MIDSNTTVCVCNDLSAGEIAKCIRDNNFTNLKELIENDICPVGNKCESCQDEGFHNDGINLPLVLSMVEKNQL
jgi:bacterioferritin-associated ferredoxin